MRTQEEIKEIAFRDFKKLKITKASIQDIFMHPRLYRGSVKTAIGAIYTNEEYEEFRQRAYNIKLP